MVRRFRVALAVAVTIGAAGLPGAAHAEVRRPWARPVDGAVERPFDPPKSRFGAGHLGVDLAAPRGAPVHSAGPGVVAFAGRVAGSLHVVVAHAGGLRTSYSYLASVSVRRGESIREGDVLGTTGGRGPAHDGSVLHLGLRVAGNYADPMMLFAPLDLSTIVHLAPTTEAPRAASPDSERRGILAGLARVATATVHIAGAAIQRAGQTAAGALASRERVPAAAVESGLAWFEQQRHCDPHAPPADGSGGSGHRAMLVAGIESSMTGRQSSLALPVAKLGYQPGEVTFFSYSANGGDYTPADTEGPIMVAARELATQLRAMQRREPGREVDLLAHSQGGVVVEAFLTLIYKRDDPSYPPLGTVVTLSSPLHGDPLASAVSEIASTGWGAVNVAMAGALARVTGTRVPLTTPAVRDLATDSRLMKRLDAARLPDEVELTTIGAATDVVVPGDAATRSGARGTTVVPSGLNAHTAILDDPSAMQAVRAALEGRPLPCQSLRTAVAGSILSTTISTIEERAGDLGEALGRVIDGRP